LPRLFVRSRRQSLLAEQHPSAADGHCSNFKSPLFRREWPYFYAFDLLAENGEDLRECRWSSESDDCAA
jgi:hypothetical protein